MRRKWSVKDSIKPLAELARKFIERITGRRAVLEEAKDRFVIRIHGADWGDLRKAVRVLGKICEKLWERNETLAILFALSVDVVPEVESTPAEEFPRYGSTQIYI